MGGGAFLLFITGLAACSSDKTPTTFIDGTEPGPYPSLAAMAADSTEILVVEAGSASIERIGSVPFSVARAKVREAMKTLSGLAAGGEVKIRQTGDPNSFPEGSEDRDVLLSRGVVYVVFLVPFEFTRGKPTGQFTTPSSMTVFRVSADAVEVWTDESGRWSGVPLVGFEQQMVPLGEIRAAVGG